MTIDADEIVRLLALEPHPEGGFFRETYRASRKLANLAGAGYSGERACATSIYYLLVPGTFSVMHRLVSDEVFHFYLGDVVEMLNLFPDGTGAVVQVGSDICNGQKLQHVVPAGVWQGSRLVPGGRFALLGTSVAPGFEFDDFEEGYCRALAPLYPEFQERIRLLAR
jgi:uncharacterized protein